MYASSVQGIGKTRHCDPSLNNYNLVGNKKQPPQRRDGTTQDQEDKVTQERTALQDLHRRTMRIQREGGVQGKEGSMLTKHTGRGENTELITGLGGVKDRLGQQ